MDKGFIGFGTGLFPLFGGKNGSGSLEIV